MLVQELKDLPAKKVRVVFEDAEDLVLYRGEIRKYRIEEGEDLPEEEYHEIFYQVIGKRAKKRAMHLLEKMDRTESDLREKLRMNGYPQELVDEAVDYVKRYHYIDDRRYAENYVRFHQGQKSAARLKMDLMRKGVSKDLIEQALSQEYQSDERKMIEQILQKKEYFSGEKLPAEQRRMYGYLLRRGYKSSDILHVMKCDDYLT